MTISLPAHSHILERQISQFVLIAPTTHLSVQEQVGALAGAAGFEKAGAASTADPEAPEKLQEEMLVLCNFSEARLDALLQGMRRSGIRIALKAMLTESNAGWTFLQLYEELSEEHARMTGNTQTSTKA